jgi:hypothetical protein
MEFFMANQKEAVYSAVLEVLGTINGPVSLTKDQRKAVVSAIAGGMEAGTVELSADAKAKFDTSKKIEGYVGGLVNNWLRKDTRLNGGTKFETKNPGSRGSSSDDQLKAMRVLRKQLEAAGSTDKISEVDAAIASRVEELKAAKTVAKKAAQIPAVDTESIPAELREMLGM